MLFVRIGKNHINMDLVDGFQWGEGMLVVALNSENKIAIPDPDKTEYLHHRLYNPNNFQLYH